MKKRAFDQEAQARLTNAVRSLAPSIRKSSDGAALRPAAVQVIDCVLSLNRSYDKFVVPRLNKFQAQNGHVNSIIDLQKRIATCSSPHEFVKNDLDYKDERRANILASVVDWLATISGTGSTESQLTKLESWARTAHPKGHVVLHIHGFGLAGFQYLRMLFGADTTKPDIHICRFVELHIGRRVSPVEALEMLETATSETGVSLRDLDATIWKNGARKATNTACFKTDS